MPTLLEEHAVLPHKPVKFGEFSASESYTISQRCWREPELGTAFRALNVNMGRFVALVRKEEAAIALGAEDCWHPATL
jgi:hypothetical protein